MWPCAGLPAVAAPATDFWRCWILAEEEKLHFLTLEVRAGNLPALALYEKHGYRRTGLRKGYYTEPREDAVLMTKEFS